MRNSIQDYSFLKLYFFSRFFCCKSPVFLFICKIYPCLPPILRNKAGYFVTIHQFVSCVQLQKPYNFDYFQMLYYYRSSANLSITFPLCFTLPNFLSQFRNFLLTFPRIPCFHLPFVYNIYLAVGSEQLPNEKKRISKNNETYFHT